ncbi:MAG: type transport system permease protein [Thermotogaceae bacterium]|nr:type transport system permease protein [Thermotogaceae bacterium]
MKKTMTMIKAFLRENFRSFESTFWSVFFPIVLFFILVSVFGNLSTSASIELKLGVIVQEKLEAFGKIFEDILKNISNEGPFNLKYYDDFEKAQKDLIVGNQDVFLVIPKGVNASLSSAFLFKTLKIEDVALEIYYVAERQTSVIAAEILAQIFDEVNIEIQRRSNRNFKEIKITDTQVKNQNQSTFSYKDYIFPGIVLMTILSVSLFNQNIGLAYNKERGTNKKLYTTPIKPLQYFSSFLITMLIIILISLVLLYVFAIFVYKVNASNILSSKFILSILLSMITLLSFGMMLTSIFKKTSTIVVTGQIMNQVLMFLGGLYFPVFDAPWAIRWIVYLLPTTYLGELLRWCIGYKISNIPFQHLLIVPMGWILFSIVIFSVNFKKVMGYE